MTFTTALDQLGLKELRLANEAQVAAATALVASSPSAGYGSAYRSSSTTSGTQQQQQQQPRRPRKNRRNGGGSAQQQARPPYPSGPVDLLQPIGRSGRMAGRPPGCWSTRWALWFGQLGRQGLLGSVPAGALCLRPVPVLLAIGALLGSGWPHRRSSADVCPRLVSVGLGHRRHHSYALF